MKTKAIWIVFALLCVVHQDCWNWDNRGLVFGFIPVGLAYHAGISLAAVTLWACAVKWAWPGGVEQWADELDGDADPATPTKHAGGGER
ncbi:MAG: hypothetical protein ACE37H_18505 [Phycisphaeraceae bacterium]